MRSLFFKRLFFAPRIAKCGNNFRLNNSLTRILVVFSLLLSHFVFAETSVDSKTEFRALLTGLINATNASDADFPKELKKVLLKHNQGLFVLANDSLFNEFAEEMDLPQGVDVLKKFDQKVAEGLELILNEELKPFSIAEKIDIAKVSQNSRRIGISTLVFLPEARKAKLLDQIPDESYLELKTAIDESVNSLDVNGLPGLSNIAPQSGEAIEGLTPEQVKEFVDVIKQYFNGLPLQQKKKILTGFINLPPHPQSSDKIAVALNGAGPLVQKLFQLVGKKHPNPTVREASVKLLESVEKVPYEDVKLIIENRYKKPIETLYKSFDKTPIATATIGQVHRAEMPDGRIVAVKVRKPGLVPRVNSEIEFLEKIAPDSIKDTINAMKKAIAEEMDFRVEAENLIKGQKYTETFLSTLPVKVPALITELKPEEDVLNSEFMMGTSLSKLLDEKNPASKDLNFLCSVGKAFEDFTSLWLWRSLKGDGFSHVDLHAGNIKVSQNDKEFQLELLDFGSTTSLTSKEVDLFVLLTVSALNGDEILLNRTIQVIERYNNAKLPKEIKKSLFDIVKDKEMPWDKKVSEMFFHLSNGKSYVPPNSTQFFRGLLFLSQHFENLNEHIDKSDPWKRYPRYTLEKALSKGITPYLNGKIFIQGNQNSDSITSHTPYLIASVARTKTKEVQAKIYTGCKNFFKKILLIK